MVKTPEENNSLVKTIAVKLSSELQVRVLSFAFLHALRDQYPDADIHLICPKQGIELLNLLPFKHFYYHDFAEEEINSIFDIHRYCATVKIYNIDLFICLTDSFLDSSLGLGLRAKKRIGFKKGFNSLVLNEVQQWRDGQHIVDNLYQLINFDPESRLKIYSRELTPIVDGEEKYIAFNVGPLMNGQIDKVWIELCQHFQNQNFVLFTDLCEDKFILNQSEFLSGLNKSNHYKLFFPDNYIELSRMLSFARGVITRSGVISCLSAYCGSPTLILNDRENPQIFGPFHFLSEIKFINLKFAAAGAALNEPARFSAEEVALSAFDFFKLSL